MVMRINDELTLFFTVLKWLSISILSQVLAVQKSRGLPTELSKAIGDLMKTDRKDAAVGPGRNWFARLIRRG